MIGTCDSIGPEDKYNHKSKLQIFNTQIGVIL